jgi:NAD(P)H-dependent FMN reductase
MTKIQIIIGSTRPNRVAPQIAQWALAQAQKRSDAEFELVDIADFDLPLYNEPLPPKMGNYQFDYTKKWAERVAEADGYVFVTSEYNHSIPASLKNALDYVYAEWNNKSAGIISYGSASGVRAAEHLRQIAAELQLADVSHNTLISMHTDFENWSTFKPSEALEKSVSGLFDQTVAWAEALAPLRQK